MTRNPWNQSSVVVSVWWRGKKSLQNRSANCWWPGPGSWLLLQVIGCFWQELPLFFSVLFILLTYLFYLGFFKHYCKDNSKCYMGNKQWSSGWTRQLVTILKAFRKWSAPCLFFSVVNATTKLWNANEKCCLVLDKKSDNLYTFFVCFLYCRERYKRGLLLKNKLKNAELSLFKCLIKSLNLIREVLKQSKN